MPKIIQYTAQPAHLAERITRHAPPGFQAETYPQTTPEAEKIAQCRDADFLILFPSLIADAVLRAAPKLKLIQLISAGFEGMNLELCQELGIPVANNGGTNSIDVAEHTIALILGYYRRLPHLDRETRLRPDAEEDAPRTMHTIHGKRTGVVGLGNIGRRVAGLLNAFGAEVVYYDEFPSSEQRERELGVTRLDVDELLATSDVVTLHVPLTDTTLGLIGQRELALMKQSALLVNTCRGKVVDEAALAVALRERRIFGAALDVLEQEPSRQGNPLLQLDNVLLTPHIAGMSDETWERRGRFICDNIRRVWDGEPPLAAVG